jgi:pseudaminic acid synthase
MNATIEIGGRVIGPGEPVYVVAELSANHHRDYGQAVRLIQTARAVGADAVKLQTYTPDTLTLDSDREFFHIGAGTVWGDRTLHGLYAEAYTPWEWQPRLKRVAEGLGLHLFSSPFDPSAVEFLEGFGVPAYKVASFELVDLPLIRRIAETGKPVILSIGMATIEEVEDAVQTVRATGNRQLALLQCASAYPAPPEAMNLRTLPDLAERFGVPVGLSDHSLQIAVPVSAVALGAVIVEKHLTLSRALGGPDAAFSLEPAEFKSMVEAVRTASRALGTVTYGPTAQEEPNLVFRRSLFAVADIAADDVFTRDNVRSIRPGHGLAPKHLDRVLGRRAARAIPRGTPLSWDLVAADIEG